MRKLAPALAGLLGLAAVTAAAPPATAASGGAGSAAVEARAAAPAQTDDVVQISVTPTDGLVDGQAVDVTITAPGPAVVLEQCDVAVVGSADPEVVARSCGNGRSIGIPDRTTDDPVPLTVPFPVYEQVRANDGETMLICGDAPADCVLRASITGTAYVDVSEPLTMVPGPPGPLVVEVEPDVVPNYGVAISVRIGGGRSGPTALAQCAASVVETRDVRTGPCRFLEEVPEGRAPTATSFSAVTRFRGADGTVVECDDAPGACVVAVGNDDGSSFASGPLAFEVDVSVMLAPDSGLQQGEAIAVTASGLRPDEAYAIVRCAGNAAVDCERAGWGVTAQSAADGTLNAAIPARSGIEVYGGLTDCRTGCWIALFPFVTSHIEGSAPYAMAPGVPVTPPPPLDEPLGLTASPTTDLVAQRIDVTVSGPTDRSLTLLVCDASVGTEPEWNDLWDHCDDVGVAPQGTRPTHVDAYVQPWFFTNGGQVVDCGDEPGVCVLAVVHFTADGVGFAAIPIDFAVRPLEVYVPPYVPHPGVTVMARVSGARSGDVGVAMCRNVAWDGGVDDGPCGPAVTVPAGSGPVEVDVVAIDHFTGADGTVVDCYPAAQTPPCVLVASTADGSEKARAPLYFPDYANAWPTPSTGLVDGQVVTLHGARMSPSENGPPFWIFPVTGRWAVAQCAGSLDPYATTLTDVFSRCVSPPGGALEVADPATPVDVAVQATIDPPLADPIDCRTADPACVLTFVRLDPDGHISTAVADPLDFA